MRFQNIVWCDGCGVEIRWPAQSEASRHFCCATCFAGRPCGCGAHLELDDDRRAVSSAQSQTVLANG